MSDAAYAGSMVAVFIAGVIFLGALGWHYRHHCCYPRPTTVTVTVQR